MRRIAAEVLGACGNPEALDSLRLALCDDDLWVRVAAVRSIGRLGGAGESQVLAERLTDPVGLVCIAVLEVLAELLGERACEQLLSACSHTDEDVVNAALNLLGRHGNRDWFQEHAQTLLDHPAPLVRSHGAYLLTIKLGQEAAPSLSRRLSTEQDPAVRQQLHDLLDGLA